MDERTAYIALNMMDKVGPVGVRSLVSELGSAGAIFDAGLGALCGARGIGGELSKSIQAQRESIDWESEMDKASSMDVRLVAQVDEEYPSQLKEIHDPPLSLYVSGSLQSRDSNSIAIVGSRHASHYGMETAEKLAFQLAKAGFVIVSGLARGIDTAAHRGALKAKGRTIAVIGSALDCIYPSENVDLAREISKSGAVISEFPFGRKPDKTTFPMRNRIVSGLSKGVLVIEAGHKSGALITARQALEQGRSVFAVPGRIDSPASMGSLDLIKKGATVVTNVEDIFHEYEFLLPGSGLQPFKSARPEPELSDREVLILKLLEQGEQDIDRLIRSSGFGPADVNSMLIGLEMKKMIRMMPGRMVEVRSFV